ncbi:GNAT family N-acetyltransferase [Candidatus Soleaferrea massiliensis]|uniref:GNAT family N-acetyltransferase n=1 Tax=Candidatus Soleaferrea massiliensis TaxID=1470354 RepID=UPI00058F3976|nr:GNAT family N-acetyltransferase [Candidatus Soleaferrea massiliensis]
MYTLRKLTPQDLQPLVELVWRVFLEFEAPEYSEAGVQTFYNYIHDADAVAALTACGAYDGETLAGVLALRGDHISLFFVAKEHHRRGIGKALFAWLLEHAGTCRFTVNSSPYAVEVYRRLGFIETDTEQLTGGIRYTPMVYKKAVD